MPKKKWIDKKHATTFSLVHRPQNDPLIYDDEASSMVFKSVGSGNQKVKTTNDLEKELGDSVTASVRKNEGEAAMYGIYYDDTEYDYMQHLRDIGTSSGAVFVEAPQPQSKQKTGKKMKLEDALRGVNEPPDLASLLPAELLPSDKLVKRTYQDQQNIPDVLAGFQPDMDPRLREVLEALEDEAYVDDDEDVFGELTKDGEKGVVSDEFLNQDGFLEGELDDYDDGGWATDDTETPTKKQGASKAIPDKPSSKSVSFPDAKSKDIDSNDAWLAEFSKFKRAQKSPQTKDQEEIASSIGDTMSLGSEYTLGGSRARRKRRGARAARTASTGYSMSSSSLYRTEGLTMLDDRFEKIEEEYANSDDPHGDVDDSTSAPRKEFIETRQDFNSIMDDFLDNYSIGGKNGRVKRGKKQSGLEQLDEVRGELGRVRIT